jgi:hypothetical protein
VANTDLCEDKEAQKALMMSNNSLQWIPTRLYFWAGSLELLSSTVMPRIIMRNLILTLMIIGATLPVMSQANENKKGSPNLREMVFNLKPNEIGLTKDNFKHPVWGIVMETGFPEGIFTLVSLADGTTSLYFSNGGGIIGSGEHENVRDASGRFFTRAQHFYKKATKVTNHPAPNNGEVKFYFFTFDETLIYSASEEKLGNDKDELSELFYAAHGVISELRKIQEQ